MNLWREFKSFVHFLFACFSIRRNREEYKNGHETTGQDLIRPSSSPSDRYMKKRTKRNWVQRGMLCVQCDCKMMYLFVEIVFEWETMCTNEWGRWKRRRNRNNIKQMEESTQNGEAEKIQSNIIKKEFLVHFFLFPLLFLVYFCSIKFI